jgi:hypothetical protein
MSFGSFEVTQNEYVMPAIFDKDMTTVFDSEGLRLRAAPLA